MRSSSCGKGWHKGQPVGQWNLPLRLFQVDKGTSATTTRFVYDGDNLAAEYNGSNAMTKRYYFGPGEDEPILEDTGGALNCSGTRFLHTNQQGSIIALADCWGNRSSIDSYDKYGIPGSANSGRFQYTGQAWLPEIGMYYYKARIYSPTLGRFLQTDPIGYKDQINLYAYVGDDPVNATDPDGLAADDPNQDDKRDNRPKEIVTGSNIRGQAGLATGRSGASTLGVTGREEAAESSSSGSTLAAQRGGQGKGERGRTAKPGGTANPDKHAKQGPRPGTRIWTDPHTGKKTIKPWPEDPRLGGSDSFESHNVSRSHLVVGGVLGAGALACAILEPCGAFVAGVIAIGGVTAVAQ